jgi:DNA-binding NtrC family response regulator
MSSSHRIMIVDDEPDLLRMVEMYLKAWKFDVDGFTDPIKALTFLQKNPSFFSLVLTDVRMPHMSGLELAQHILRIKPDVGLC